MKKYEANIKFIVLKYGGYREKRIFSNPHTLQASGTWNDEHKVIHVIENKADPDGHKDGFSVDIVTRSICG